MKPDIIKYNTLTSIDKYLGVFCKCGNTLYIKNNPSLAKQRVVIECPCGENILSIYTSYSHN